MERSEFLEVDLDETNTNESPARVSSRLSERAPPGHIFLLGKRWCEFHFFDDATCLERWLAEHHFDDAFTFGWFDACGEVTQIVARKVRHNGRTLFVTETANIAWND